MLQQQKPRIPVSSQQGRRDTVVVGGLRLASALATGGALIAIGFMVDLGVQATNLTVFVCFAVVAGLLACGEISYGGRAARAEEKSVRAEILERQFRSASDPGVARDAYPPARLIQMMTDGAERVTEYRQVYFGSTIAAMIIPVVALLYIGIAIDPVVGFVILCLVPVIPLAIWGFMKLFRKTSANSRKQRSALTVRYLDAIRNLVTIRLLGAGERVTEELRAQGEKNRGAIMKLLAGNQIVIIVMDGIFSLLLICATVWLTISSGQVLTAGEALTIIALTVLLLEPLQQVAGFFYIGMGGMASQREIRGYFAATSHLSGRGHPSQNENGPDISASPAPHSPCSDGVPVSVEERSPLITKTATSDREEKAERGLAIALDGVTFDYGRGPVLEDLHLDVPAGARVAVVGPSGAGKSTLLGLLRGSIPPQSGNITIGAQNLADMDPDEIRSLTATVSQSTWMFTGTIADNLRIARADASEEDMWNVLRLAHIDTEVSRMPNQLHTDLGEGAALISGGQAQRLSLARALLSGRKILLLDEPTSQIDIESEGHIIDALGALPREWTLLMVTHRPSLLRIADSVHTLRHGALISEETTYVYQ